jgi:hypothetical protein
MAITPKAVVESLPLTVQPRLVRVRRRTVAVRAVLAGDAAAARKVEADKGAGIGVVYSREAGVGL